MRRQHSLRGNVGRNRNFDEFPLQVSCRIRGELYLILGIIRSGLIIFVSVEPGFPHGSIEGPSFQARFEPKLDRFLQTAERSISGQVLSYNIQGDATGNPLAVELAKDHFKPYVDRYFRGTVCPHRLSRLGACRAIR